MSKLQHNVPLAELTSFGVGGTAESYLLVSSTDELLATLIEGQKPDWLFSHGANVLISDKGLPGLTIHIKGGKIERSGNTLTADAGVTFDQLVQESIEAGLWGLELMSGIPGSVGAAAYINISSYGQNAGQTIEWVECWDQNLGEVIRIERDMMSWDYKQSIFQEATWQHLIILRVAFELSPSRTTDLTYDSALRVVDELNADLDDLVQVREVILEARKQTGAYWDPDGNNEKTVGSYFRNPVVTQEQAKHVSSFDEKTKDVKAIMERNRTHGGQTNRVSAALVMLAAGYSRGQEFGDVRLHPKNVLKIENTGGASAQDIYTVGEDIRRTVKDKLDIDLIPEVQILGDFT